MNKHIMFLILLSLPSLVGAEWVLHQSDNGHWVSSQNRQQHQLIISQNGQHKRFLLIISLRHKNYVTPQTAQLIIDEEEENEYALQLIKKRHNGAALQLVMNDIEQDHLITQLVNGLHLKVNLDSQVTTDFSLSGFTNTFSDFLIANDVGRLDPLWLQMQNYKKELLCYEISRAMVTAIKLRKHGKSETEVHTDLSGQMSDEAEAALIDVIEQTFSVPVASLPKIPSTRKYEFFKRCMQTRK